ncbi:MAG: sulfur oxidation c-type cytochrome SoxX, partial [Chromatiaceae bacterium]
ALGAAAVGLAATAAASQAPVDYTKMTPTELTEYLIFDAKGFKLDQPTQEGKTGRERMTQDELQKTCSALHGKTIDAETAKKVQALAAASRVYPEGGVTLGDWKRGQALAQEGAGYRLGPKADDNAKKFGGNCYACHQMDLKVSAHGTLGPSLTGFGKIRGNTPETQKYVYEVLYNAHAYFPCTNMPRFGANGFLNQEQMADLIAYVLDPESPVNK